MRNLKIVVLALLIINIGLFALLIFENNKAAGKFNLHLQMRSHVKCAPESDRWKEVTNVREFPAGETAIIIIDMWNCHWSKGATRRMNRLAPAINDTIEEARKNGVRIIHAPSDIVIHYEKDPHRIAIKNIPMLDLPYIVDNEDFVADPEPIDATDGGSDTPGHNIERPEREHPAIMIKGRDVISADVCEIFSFLKQNNIKNVIYMGVHANACVMNRPFGIRKMKKLGFNVVLVRNLTDCMYNPQMPPYVTHEKGTELFIEYIEKYRCPTILSGDLMKVYPPGLIGKLFLPKNDGNKK
ncbi:MAG: cysteine hydrolase [Chloroflexi bacterium]|nr:cysteine hydrolase [Chloroflexota bacterium]